MRQEVTFVVFISLCVIILF